MGRLKITGVDVECELAYGDNDQHRCAWCGQPLGARRRRWCSPAHERAFGANHFWTQARAAALRRDHHECVCCHDPFGLEVHHDPPLTVPYSVGGCHHHLDRLTTLCRVHHGEAHRILRAAGKDVPIQLTLLGAVA